MFLILLPEVAGLAVGMAMLVDNVLIIPVAIAIVAALLVEAFAVELPEVLDRSVNIVANSSSAVALFAIGGMLVGLKLRGQLRDILTAVGGKLLLMPVLAVALVTLLPMLGLPALTLELRVAAVLTAALPSMSVMATVAEQHGEGDLGAASMMLSMVCSFVTLTAWMLGLTAIGWL